VQLDQQDQLGLRVQLAQLVQQDQLEQPVHKVPQEYRQML
jgi:hypothetical protein